MNARLTNKELFYPSKLEKLVLYYRLHPIQCAKDVFNVRLIWFQRISFRILWWCSAVFLFFGRGVGKTYLLALFACMRAILYPDREIGYYTPTAKQWDQFWSYVERFYDRCPIFADSVKIGRGEKAIKRVTGTVKMKFKNNSYIKSIVLHERSRSGRNTEGIFDEYKDHDNNAVNTVGLPFLFVEQHPKYQNKQIFATTGFYNWSHAYLKYVYYKYKELLGDKQYRILEFDHRDVDIVPDSPYRMSAGMLEQVRLDPTMTKEKYDMEVYCKIATEADAVFTYKLLNSNKVTPKGEDEVQMRTESYVEGRLPNEEKIVALRRGCLEKKYVIGIDNARVAMGDNSVLQIGELDEYNRKVSLVYSFAMNGIEIPVQALKVFEMVKKFNIVRINIDNDSYGKALKDLLALGSDQYGVPPLYDIDDKIHQQISRTHSGKMIIRMISFTVPNIMEMMDKLKSSFEDGKLLLPVDMRNNENRDLYTANIEIQRTKRELSQLQIENRGNGYVYTAPEGKKRDRAMALALMNMAVVDYYYADIITKPQRITEVGSWV